MTRTVKFLSLVLITPGDVGSSVSDSFSFCGSVEVNLQIKNLKFIRLFTLQSKTSKSSNYDSLINSYSNYSNISPISNSEQVNPSPVTL